MSDSLVPELREIRVQASQLFLDPNNPRLISRHEDRRPTSAAITHAHETQRRMEEVAYKVDELKKSIKENGWIPVDYIFVQRIPGKLSERYLVLEGNRRVTAIRGLLESDDLDQELRKSIEKISVMEVVDNLPEKELKKKISYLLGVRHHGALVKWSPFAQAKNIFLRYREMLGTDFKWDKNIALQVANALSIQLDEVKERLQVYVAMQQLSECPKVVAAAREDARCGMHDQYYSVVAEVANNQGRYGEYLTIDPATLLLNEAAAEKMINLCHFDKPKRAGAPINNPQQWRKLHQILSDADPEKRRINLDRVETNKEKPSDVWAERASELRQLQWDKWLIKVDGVLRRVTIDDVESLGAKEAATRLDDLLNELADMRQIS